MILPCGIRVRVIALVKTDFLFDRANVVSFGLEVGGALKLVLDTLSTPTPVAHFGNHFLHAGLFG